MFVIQVVCFAGSGHVTTAVDLTNFLKSESQA